MVAVVGPSPERGRENSCLSFTPQQLKETNAMSMEKRTRAPRSSPAHLVFKFGCAVQQLLDLATQLDTKNLSIKQTTRLPERMHDLDCALWPDEPHGEAKEAAIQNEGALADAAPSWEAPRWHGGQDVAPTPRCQSSAVPRPPLLTVDPIWSRATTPQLRTAG